MSKVLEQAKKAKDASKILKRATTEQKNAFLNALADSLVMNSEKILQQNRRDLGENKDLTTAMRRRLELSAKGLESIAASVRVIAKLPDPVGATISEWIRPDGLQIKKVRSPIGVLVCIFESRPNVIVDVAMLCVKSGNVVIMRGGKEITHSNDILMEIIKESLEKAGLPISAVQQLEDRRYEAVCELVQLDKYIDIVIPRGGEALINNIVKCAKVPVLKHFRGLCHMYIDKDADFQKAVDLAVNAKTSNPATCNSIETILIHKDTAGLVLPKLVNELVKREVEVRGCDKTREIIADENKCKKATEEDWSKEYLDLIVSVKTVDSYEEAVSHIEKYSSGLTDSIVTENKNIAQKFLKDIDSATVLVNASNRLVDGGEFGLGGEIGINTSHIHSRGPMGLEDLTVGKYIVVGEGHIRK